jgi:hypothetical protein
MRHPEAASGGLKDLSLWRTTAVSVTTSISPYLGRKSRRAILFAKVLNSFFFTKAQLRRQLRKSIFCLGHLENG